MRLLGNCAGQYAVLMRKTRSGGGAVGLRAPSQWLQHIGCELSSDRANGRADTNRGEAERQELGKGNNLVSERTQ